MAFYNSVESGVWLRKHQLDHIWEKLSLRIFTFLAKLRNRTFFFHFTIDRKLYTKFRDGYYKRRELKSQRKKS